MHSGLIPTLTNTYKTYGQIIFGNTEDQGPVVQSMVSLTSSLRGQLVKCVMTL